MFLLGVDTYSSCFFLVWQIKIGYIFIFLLSLRLLYEWEIIGQLANFWFLFVIC